MTRTLLLTTLMAGGLITTGCGATTAGVKNALAQKAVSTAVTSATQDNTVQSMDAPVVMATAPKAGDAAMSCAKLQTRIAALGETMTTAQAAAGDVMTLGEQQAATSAVAQGAVSLGMKSGIAKAVPFAGMFGQAAIERTAAKKQKRANEARETYAKASSRRATLMGVAAGKGCDF